MTNGRTKEREGESREARIPWEGEKKRKSNKKGRERKILIHVDIFKRPDLTLFYSLAVIEAKE